MESNVKNVALIFEGGGMRNSYSSGVVNALLENGIFFDSVYGLSAGATNAVNYLSRDIHRSKISLTEYIDDLSFRKLVTFLLHREAEIWPRKHPSMAKEGVDIPFDFETFRNNPARLTLQAFERDTGKTVYLTDKDFATKQGLMKCVRASTSYPVIMPPENLGDSWYYDGGIGEGGGIMLAPAKADGYKKFFVVCTRPKGFRKPEKPNRLYDVYFWHRPYMRETLNSWSQRYNLELDLLEKLEEEGRAYVFYAEDQGVENTERSIEKLTANYERGYRQAQSELSAWKAFLDLE